MLHARTHVRLFLRLAGRTILPFEEFVYQWIFHVCSMIHRQLPRLGKHLRSPEERMSKALDDHPTEGREPDQRELRLSELRNEGVGQLIILCYHKLQHVPLRRRILRLLQKYLTSVHITLRLN